MSNPPVRSGIVVALLLATIVAGCARAAGTEPSATPIAQPSNPAPATPQPTEEPAEQPTPEPAQPSVAPQPTDEPITVIRFDPRTVAGVNADGVALRVLPGLEQPLVIGYDFATGGAPAVRLSDGDTVMILWGPVLVDGHTWYATKSADAGTLTWDVGWIAADFLVDTGTTVEYPLVATADGLGSGKAVTGTVTAFAPLYVNAVVSPMSGDDSCTAEVVVVGTDGTVVEIGSGTVTETTQFFSSPLENSDLTQEDAGTITLQVRTDCAWAAMAFEPIG